MKRYTSSFGSFFRRKLSATYKQIKKRINALRPLTDAIVLECESDMADNPYAFYEYLLYIEFNKKHKIYWIVRDKDASRELYGAKNVCFISRFSKEPKETERLERILSTSRVFVFSHPYWFTQWKKKQTVICTTHSVAQLKAAGNLRDKHVCDYVLSCSNYCSEIKKLSFGEGTKCLEIGIPRLDIINEKTDSRDILNKLLLEQRGRKIVLSMETFKQSMHWSDSTANDSFSINVVHNQEELHELDLFLEEINCIMIVKIHHLQDLSFLHQSPMNNIIYLKDEDLFRCRVQINELLSSANVLLTDYSSVFYDYLLLDRPIGFLIGDMSEYDRGFIMENPLEEMPGEKINSLAELKMFLQKAVVDPSIDSDKRNAIKEKVFKFMDRNNSKRLFEWLVESKRLKA